MSQQVAMTMAGMGGPVGAMNVGTPNNGIAMGGATNTDQADYAKRLNTYIYDYFMRHRHYDCAKAMLNESLAVGLHSKSSPGQRNGADEMDMDNKGIIDHPKDMPLPDLPATGGPFLEDWWFQFWDIWNSRRSANGKASTLAYLSHQRNAQKARSGMMGAMDPTMQRNLSMMNGGVMPADLKKAAMQNSSNMNPAHMQAMARRAQQGQMMQGNPMERQGSQMDRSGSPGSGGHPSPKRPRVEGGMNNMQMPGQQPQRPGQIPNNQSLDSYNASMQATMKNALNQAQASSNMNKGMPPNSAAAAAAIQAGAQGSPMPQAMDGMMFDGGANGMMRGPTMVPNQQVAAAAAAMGNQGGQNGSGGSHALQDYQMQLMLLEQQNKRRLMMARQEQDGMSSHTGVPASNGQFAPNLSPGQANPSPNPNDMQRGTPKMNNGPSPNGNLAGRGSPAPGGQFDPNMPPVMRNQMMMGPNGPRSNPQMTQAQLEMMRQQGMMSNGNFQMNPGMQPNMMQGQHPGQGQPGQVAPNMTPRQGNNPMPPPPAPQQNATGNTQPSSPAPTAAPPTPSQTAKTKPGAKKDNKVGKAGNKKNAAAATPASESEQPPTPGSQAPVTPMHAKMNGPAGVANGGQANGMPGMGQPSDLGGFNMDPTNSFVMGDFTMDTGTGDVLENFDFDAFLNNSDGDGTLAFSVGDDFNFDPVAGVDGTDLQ